MAGHGFDIDADEAYDLLDRWRKYGIVRDESLSEFLDDVAVKVRPPRASYLRVEERELEARDWERDVLFSSNYRYPPPFGSPLRRGA